MAYPLFTPPNDLADKPRREWSKTEAERYLKWLVSILDDRVHYLLKFLDENSNLPPEELLRRIGGKVEAILKNQTFYNIVPAHKVPLKQGQFQVERQEGKQLSNEGYALAADLGLLVAQLLLEAGKGKIYWETLKKPKSEVSYNLPVLKGFENLHLDPIRGSIAETTWLLTGHPNKDAWLKIYLYWLGKIA